LSQHISRAIHELQAIPVPEDLANRTLGRLQLLPNRKRTSFVASVLAAFILVAAVAFIAPRYATAGTLQAIRQAVEGKVVHIRTFRIDGGKKSFEGELWTDGSHVRHMEGEKLSVSDGTKTIELDRNRRTARVSAGPAFKYAPSGFSLDAILNDMAKTQNLGSVQVSNKTVDGRQSLVAEFSDQYSRFSIFCYEESRLPYRIEVADRKSKQRLLMEVSILETAGDALFKTTIPEGYKVIDLDKGFDGFAQKPVYILERENARFELYSVDINEHGDLFVLFGADHLTDLTLSIGSPYAGPLKMENTRQQQSLIRGRQAYVWVWATGNPAMQSVIFDIDLFGGDSLSESTSPNRISGEPDYFAFAIERSASKPQRVSIEDLRFAIGGPKSLPRITEDSLVIDARFDARTSMISGAVQNTTRVEIPEVGLTYKLFDANGFVGVMIVRVGDVPAGKSVTFSQEAANVEKASPLPVISVVFDSIYDKSKGISVSPK